MSRQEVLDVVRKQPEVSVLIVGGGVNGIGTFRDLALQGIDVLLVEKNDFCSGASAASSHMLHGGIRYLENGEFRLVREALTERNRMLQNAPHYSKPLPTTIPIFSWFSGTFNAPLKFLNLRDKPGERGALVIKIGLILYDWFTRGQQGLPGHKTHSRAASMELRPQINPDILCTAAYYDAWMPYPERICIEMILDAEASSPKAHALNYMSLESASGDTIHLRDEVTGEIIPVKPHIVVNAAGPWIDLANRNMGEETQYIGGTKGSHIVVDNPELHEATHGNEMFFENNDGRICLFFPLLDKVLIGTTDIRVNNPDDAICTEEEVDYMLEAVKIVFPKIHLDRSQIVYRFCGVRPLPSSVSSRTGAISRDHSIQIIGPDDKIKFPVLSLIGGKWTTFRAFSEQVTDRLLMRLGKSRQVSTQSRAIGGGKGCPRSDGEREKWLADLQREAGLPPERSSQLFERYGTRAHEIAIFIAAKPDMPLKSQPDYSQREALFLAMHEKILHLDDLILRRSLLGMLGFATGDLLAEIAATLAPEMGWSADEIRQEIARTAMILETQHGVDKEKLQISG